MTGIQSSAVKKHSNKWRVVDIVVAAIIAVASGVIFWAWDIIYAVPIGAFDSLTPGLGGLFNFMWLFAGPLGHHRAQAWCRVLRGDRGSAHRGAHG